jgi:hypothetical protein
VDAAGAPALTIGDGAQGEQKEYGAVAMASDRSIY